MFTNSIARGFTDGVRATLAMPQWEQLTIGALSAAAGIGFFFYMLYRVARMIVRAGRG